MHQHPSYPWLLSRPALGGVEVRCAACGSQAVLRLEELGSFVQLHANHRGSSSTHLGAGDVVAAVAKPIARALGKQPCTPCEQRRAALNAWLPTTPFRRR